MKLYECFTNDGERCGWWYRFLGTPHSWQSKYCGDDNSPHQPPMTGHWLPERTEDVMLLQSYGHHLVFVKRTSE